MPMKLWAVIKSNTKMKNQSKIIYKKENEKLLENGIFTEGTLANELGISVWTIRTWRTKYGLPCFKTGRQIYYRKASFDEWFSKRETEHVDATQIGNIRRIN